MEALRYLQLHLWLLLFLKASECSPMKNVSSNVTDFSHDDISRISSLSFDAFVAAGGGGYFLTEDDRSMIRNADVPMNWRNHSYFWVSKYYRIYGIHHCHISIPHDHLQLGRVHFQNGTRAERLIWRCYYYEDCCGHQCCYDSSSMEILKIGLVLMGFLICIAILDAVVRNSNKCSSGDGAKVSVITNR